MPSSTRRFASSRGSIASGLGITLALHAGVQTILFIALFTFLPKGEPTPLFAVAGGPRLLAFAPVFYIGASQLLYVVPALLVALHRDRTATATGIVIAATATAVLNGAWLLAFLMGGP